MKKIIVLYQTHLMDDSSGAGEFGLCHNLKVKIWPELGLRSFVDQYCYQDGSVTGGVPT